MVLESSRWSGWKGCFWQRLADPFHPVINRHLKSACGRYGVQCLLLCLAPLAYAGSIGFSINMTGEDIVITNTGNEAAYQMTEWTLNASGQWQPVQWQEGNPAWVAPGKKLKGRRLSLTADTSLGRADPLLLMFYDAAGSQFSQLAWRKTPAFATHPLHVQRQDHRVTLDKGDISNIAITYAIAVPDEGIASLARAFASAKTPPRPMRHDWTKSASLVIETGQGQQGVWLIHESSTGDLQIQIVPDGLPAGQEQIPRWLVWMRLHLLKWAGILALVGMHGVMAGLMWSAHRGKLFTSRRYFLPRNLKKQ